MPGWLSVPEIWASCWKRSMKERYCGLERGMSEPDGLDRELALDQRIEGLVDSPHRPVAEVPRDLVAPDRGGTCSVAGFLTSLIEAPVVARSVPTLSRQQL
jgi:hypothetical protein